MKNHRSEVIIGVIGLIIAAIALIPAFGQWLFPQETRPSNSSGQSSIFPSPIPQSTQPMEDQIVIDWHTLEVSFRISKSVISRQSTQNPIGQIYEFNVLTFDVESRTDFMMAIFFAHFYDAQGREVDTFSPVQFEPDYSSGGWSHGIKSRAIVILPDDMSKVKRIKFTSL